MSWELRTAVTASVAAKAAAATCKHVLLQGNVHGCFGIHACPPTTKHDLLTKLLNKLWFAELNAFHAYFLENAIIS